jgi:iron-sulfur cluster assembly protein/iron-sulfur cluster insertion protein
VNHYVVDSRKIGNPATGVILDLVAQRTLGDGQSEADFHIASPDCDITDHPEFNDVAAQFGITHSLECLEDGLSCDHTLRVDGRFVLPGWLNRVDAGYNEVKIMTQVLSIKSNQPQKVVTVTDNAALKIGELIAAEGDTSLALRMAVRPGGCSGFSYEMYFDSEIDEVDIVEAAGDIRVVVDPESAEMVKGSVLDYKDGLMGAGFAIENPNVTRSCGCGNSFS